MKPFLHSSCRLAARLCAGECLVYSEDYNYQYTPVWASGSAGSRISQKEGADSRRTPITGSQSRAHHERQCSRGSFFVSNRSMRKCITVCCRAFFNCLTGGAFAPPPVGIIAPPVTSVRNLRTICRGSAWKDLRPRRTFRAACRVSVDFCACGTSDHRRHQASSLSLSLHPGVSVQFYNIRSRADSGSIDD